MEPVILKSERIILRRPKKSDAESITRHAHDREIARWTFIPYPYHLEDAHTFLRRSARLHRKGTALHLAIQHRETGDVIGMIGLEAISTKHGRGEVGYWLSRKYRGKGIMSESLRLALDYYFRTLKLKRVHAHVFPGNTASIQLLGRAGFTLEGTLRNHIRRGNQWRDLLVYGILCHEFTTASRARTKARAK